MLSTRGSGVTTPIQTSERKDNLVVFSEDEQNREIPKKAMGERAIPATNPAGIERRGSITFSSEITPRNLSEAKMGYGDAPRVESKGACFRDSC